MNTETLLANLLLYVFFPLWGIVGFIDWYCHKKSNIQQTSGLFESFLHCIMGIQIGIALILCLLFEINALVIAICLLCYALHELVAHIDIKFATGKRKISLLEVHAHNYLATLPLFIFSCVFILNWPAVLDLITLNFSGNFSLIKNTSPLGGDTYFKNYLMYMSIVCIFPYAEEFFRCVYFYKFQKNKETN